MSSNTLSRFNANAPATPPVKVTHVHSRDELISERRFWELCWHFLSIEQVHYKHIIHISYTWIKLKEQEPTRTLPKFLKTIFLLYSTGIYASRRSIIAIMILGKSPGQWYRCRQIFRQVLIFASNESQTCMRFTSPSSSISSSSNSSSSSSSSGSSSRSLAKTCGENITDSGTEMDRTE